MNKTNQYIEKTNQYLAECNTSDDCTGYDEMLIAIKLAFEDGECLCQNELYDFMNDVLMMDGPDIYDTLKEQDKFIYKRETTDSFFRDLMFNGPDYDD